MKQIIPNVHTLTGLRVGRVYALQDHDGWTLVDAAVPSAAQPILDQFAALGAKPTDIKRILITHGHADHIGALPELKARTGAQVIASAQDRSAIEGTQPVAYRKREELSWMVNRILPPTPTMPGTPVDRVVGEGDVLDDVLGGMQVLHVPGHSPGHLAFWQPQQRLLISGDVILNFVGLTVPFPMFTPDMTENKRSIRRLAELNADIFCPGHGAPITRNTAEKIRRFATRLDETGDAISQKSAI